LALTGQASGFSRNTRRGLAKKPDQLAARAHIQYSHKVYYGIFILIVNPNT